ncbi:DNA adenine methylase [Candidatus Parcubacteria bacterium]|nr:DNA adenine methylase [Candidatus Parcubacteria bacterium]
MRFIGCKENLLNFIEIFVKKKEIRGNVFCDLFAGTGSVAKHFKKLGYKIISSDILYFSYVLQKVYIEQNQYPKFIKLLKHLKINPVEETLFASESRNAKEIIKYLNNLEGIEGFIYKNYSPEGTRGKTYIRKYFTGDNAKRIDAIREKIEEWGKANFVNNQEYYFLLASLIEAVPFVANISGIYSAFLKEWDKRAFKRLTLKVPEIIKSKEINKVYYSNGLKVLDQVKGIDILYLDPPYNERQYAPNYHILETIAKWDKPEIKGITGMRSYENQKSEFCNSVRGIKALGDIIQKNNFKHLLLSYNNDGIIPESKILKLFNEAGKIEIAEQNYQRYKSNSNGKQKNGVKEKIYYLKKVSPKNKLNDLSGSEWIFFLNSVEVTHYSTKGVDGFAHHLRGKHPSPKPPQLMKKFVDFFTKENQIVFDPFMGVGGTLIACSLSNRVGIGVDLSEEYIDLYKKVCKELDVSEQKAIVGNSLEIEKVLPKNTQIDFILTDPPYGEMLSKKRTGQKKKKTGIAVATPFTNNGTDLGNMERENFLESLKDVIMKSAKYLKLKGYIAIFVKDLQPNKNGHNMLHCSITEKLLEIPNFSFKGYKIWYDATQKLYPFGYPHAFVANQFHQFIMIFRKEE